MRTSRALLIGLAFTVFAAAAVAAAAQGKPGGNPVAAKLKNPVRADAASLAAGQAIYVRRCQGCHGADGKGGPGASNLVDARWDHGSADGEIFWIIKNGATPSDQQEYLPAMEAWGDRLKDPDIWNVVNYVRTLAPKRP